MQNIHYTTGPVSFNTTYCKSGNIGDGAKIDVKVVIQEANSIDILSIFNSYGLGVGKSSKVILCPFPFHDDTSPSFYIYHHTNSFYCWSCKHGGRCTDFVSYMEGISKFAAANRLLNNFEPDVNFAPSFSDWGEKHKLNLEFSNLIRDFIENNSSDTSAVEYADKLCLIFDTICHKHKLDVDGLKLLIRKLTTKVKQYKCQ